jgi:hypothetical protein
MTTITEQKSMLVQLAIALGANSDELQNTQDALKRVISAELESPMINYTKLRNLITELKAIDRLRRDTWGKERFGHCDEKADDALNILRPEFCADDIPF